MARSEWVLIRHVVVFALWFGTDLATFTLSRRVVRPDQPARAELAGAMKRMGFAGQVWACDGPITMPAPQNAKNQNPSRRIKKFMASKITL